MTAGAYVVVGGTSGLGLAVARALVGGAAVGDRAAGGRVWLVGNVPDEVAQVTAELGCPASVCDVADFDQVRDTFAQVVERFGTVDGVAHCASMWAGGSLEELSPEHIRRAVEVNAIGTTYVLKEALRHLRRQGHGNIVYVGALAVTRPRPGIPVYQATKHYTTSLVEAVAEAQHSNRIKVMVLHPGPMPTRLQERVGAEFLDDVYALPEQVATEVVRLLRLAPDDLYVSGQRILRGDGRW